MANTLTDCDRIKEVSYQQRSKPQTHLSIKSVHQHFMIQFKYEYAPSFDTFPQIET